MPTVSSNASSLDLSIVSPLYMSAPYLEEFYRRICDAAEQIADSFELILVNDGSPDGSLEIATGLFERDARVSIIDLSRNFGQHKAIMTGLAYAGGSLVFLIDCDLEVDPEVIQRFYRRYRSTAADVVFGVQESRNDPLFRRVAARLFYVIFNWLSDAPLPTNLLTTRLMTDRYVSALVSHTEREVLIGGLWVVTGFDQVPIQVRKTSKGSTTYSVRRRISMLVNAVTSFSSRPLVLIFYLGLIISVISGVSAIALVIRRLFVGPFLEGWPSLIVSMWLIGGMIIFCIGVIGIYLSKVYMETKRRPYTIIRRHYRRTERTIDEI